MTINGVEYTTGLSRQTYPEPKTAHLYRGPFNDPGNPMCIYGWNRDNGESYSIWRNNGGDICKICLKRAEAGLPPITEGKHKTNPNYI